MAEPVIRSMIDQDFVPKDRADMWRVAFGANMSSGYDFLLVVENPETKVTYQIEVGITADGRLCGQITPDLDGHGPDALVLFDTSHQIARISGNAAGPQMILDANDPSNVKIIPNPYEKEQKGFV